MQLLEAESHSFQFDNFFGVLLHNMVAGVAVFGLAGCATLEKIDRELYGVHQSVTEEDLVTGQRSIGFHSRTEQIESGNAAMQRIVGKYTALNEKVSRRAYARLQRIFSRVHRVSHFAHEDWEVLLLPEDGFNAFVTGGTFIAVYKGLLDQTPDDAAVAAVLGHEIGHVTANHVFEQQQMLTALAARSGTGFDFVYGALNEEEADKIGVLYTALAGYDPYAVSRLWGRLARVHGDDWSWFRTHPAGSDRARATRLLAKKTEPYYRPGVVNPSHEQLVRCNAFWCNR